MLMLFIYFIPTIFALLFCDKDAAKTIFLINLLIGWTGIGWILALILAVVHS